LRGKRTEQRTGRKETASQGIREREEEGNERVEEKEKERMVMSKSVGLKKRKNRFENEQKGCCAGHHLQFRKNSTGRGSKREKRISAGKGNALAGLREDPVARDDGHQWGDSPQKKGGAKRRELGRKYEAKERESLVRVRLSVETCQ